MSCVRRKARRQSTWEVADGNKISEVRIISLKLNDHEGKRVSRDYRDLRREFVSRSVDLEWRTIDSAMIRDTHDRWIIGNSEAWNVPNVGAIYSGQHSEINESEHAADLQKIFDGYWKLSKSFLPERGVVAATDDAFTPAAGS
jgi:hypothetical protein